MNNLTAASNTFLSASKSAHIRGLNHKKHKGMTQLPLHQSEVLLEHKSHVNFGKLHHSILSFSSTFDFARVQIPLVNSHRHTDTHTHTFTLKLHVGEGSTLRFLIALRFSFFKPREERCDRFQ